MINQSLFSPRSIVIVGGSDNIHRPGGKVVKNIIDSGYSGILLAVNPKYEWVQGMKSYPSVNEIPEAELAIMAIPSQFCFQAAEILVKNKKTKAFIVISAGFSEQNEEGRELEEKLTLLLNDYKACLIGPNCTGVITPHYSGIFTSPLPKLSQDGCVLISGSGATAAFIMESAIQKGLTFSSVFTVGNSAQTSVEDILAYYDNSGLANKPKILMLYIEKINNPDKFLHSASSLVHKGFKLAAIKAGRTAAGNRAALSHTGAMAGSDSAVEALFRKAGVVRCFGREGLTTVACVLSHKKLKGKNIAIITHAGGPGVMLADALSDGGLEIPPIEGPKADELLSKLYPGAAVSNPIDILATGNHEQLALAIDYCAIHFKHIHAIVVIYGTTGLTEVFDTYELLHKKIKEHNIPLFPVLPSVTTAKEEVDFFRSKGHVWFPDEVVLGKAITKVINTPAPSSDAIDIWEVDVPEIRRIIEKCPSGFIPQETIEELFHAANIPIVPQVLVTTEEQLTEVSNKFEYPLVAKVEGPVHKSDIGGVALNIKSKEHLIHEFHHLIKLKGATGVLVQPMLKGIELFIGATYEKRFGHVVLCGLGGIFVEVLQDVSSGLAPLTFDEAISMIHSLKSYKIIQGTRGKTGVDEKQFAKIIMRLSTMLRFATEIKEMDMNPLIATNDSIVAVDVRIRTEK